MASEMISYTFLCKKNVLGFNPVVMTKQGMQVYFGLKQNTEIVTIDLSNDPSGPVFFLQSWAAPVASGKLTNKLNQQEKSYVEIFYLFF